jgi:hypothetical protein
MTKPQVPQTKNQSWAKTDIDRFILAKLEAKGLKPVRRADDATLIRRLYLDLTGLPPAPDASTENLVDRLLDSRAFAERWGRHWLDVARYSETTGGDANVTLPEAWRYRDYVIESFAQDKPFNEFIREQIAGDLLPAKTVPERAENLIATGFLAIGQKSLNGTDPRQFAVDLADEQIDTASQAFMATTISCARCHDHKFDPISQRDYTSIAGIFLSTDTRYGTAGGVRERNASTQNFGSPHGARRMAAKENPTRPPDRAARRRHGRTQAGRKRVGRRGNDWLRGRAYHHSSQAHPDGTRCLQPRRQRKTTHHRHARQTHGRSTRRARCRKKGRPERQPPRR